VTLSKLLAPFIPFITESMYQNLVRTIDPSAPVSVHLNDYPLANPSRVDAGLSKDMATVLEVVRLGRAARSEANIKVRQPLPAVLVYSREPSAMDAVVRLKDQVLDELNVKEVRPLTELSDVVAYDIRPKLSVLGPKYGKQLSEVRKLLSDEVPESVEARTSAGEPVELTLSDGQVVSLTPDEILVDLTKRSGYAAAQGQLATVVLDTAVTAELIQEGLVRDFVRGVQDARKSAGYRIEDRILVEYAADPEVAGAIDQHAGYVRTEVLADDLAANESIGASDQIDSELTEGPGGITTADGVYLDQIDVGQHHVRIKLRRVAA
jgi:isoleucyl-tRNA synthetase